MSDETIVLITSLVALGVGMFLGYMAFSDPGTTSVVVEACTQTPLFTESGEAVYMCGIN